MESALRALQLSHAAALERYRATMERLFPSPTGSALDDQLPMPSTTEVEELRTLFDDVIRTQEQLWQAVVDAGRGA